jgi:hypothetical protein
LKLFASRIPIWVILTLLSAIFASPGAAQTPANRIELLIIQGEGATNTAGKPAAVPPKVRAVNENQQPLAGAVVVFNLPVSGTSGEFEKGSKNLTVTTDQEGVATAEGLKVNGIPGRLQILVTARYRGLAGRTLINQTVEGSGVAAGHHGGSGKWIAILAIVGAAAAGGAVAATHKGGSSSAPPASTPIGITPGTVTITHP